MNTSFAIEPALFVTHRAYLQKGGGGAQWCTREYRSTLARAGFEQHDVVFDSRTDLLARMKQQVLPSPEGAIPGDTIAKHAARAAAASGATWCFLNNSDAGLIAPLLRARIPGLRLAFLSHGVELTDVVNNLRLAPASLSAARQQPRFLGRLLQSEIRQRAAIDVAFCISESDQLLEHWLGARSAVFLPRQIPHDPLPGAPRPGRVGCVSTLDHGPNRNGLEQLAAVLGAHPQITLRLVGGPAGVGHALAERFPGISYCGQLDEAALRAEAATWSAFVNPIFCAARGASTKVATALGWGLPVFTTPYGARGYRWREDRLPLAHTPTGLAHVLAEASAGPDFQRWFDAANEIRLLAPSLEESATLMRHSLDSIQS